MNAPYLKNHGFTLTEIIVSIVVLGLIIGGAVRTFGVALYLHEQNEQRVTAAYLAQECLEIIRNNRDTNWLQNQAWDNNITAMPAPFDEAFTRDVTVKILDEKKVDDPESKTSPKKQIVTPIEKEFTCTISWNDDQSQLAAAEILTHWQQ